MKLEELVESVLTGITKGVAAAKASSSHVPDIGGNTYQNVTFDVTLTTGLDGGLGVLLGGTNLSADQGFTRVKFEVPIAF